MRSKDKIAYYYDGTLLSLSLSHSPISYFSLSFMFLFKSFNSLIIKNQNPSCIRTRPISLSPCIYHLILYLDAIMMLNQNRTTISTIHLQSQNELIFYQKKIFLTNIFHKVKLARFYLPIIPGVGVKFFAKLFVSIDIEKIDSISQESQQISQLLTWNSRWYKVTLMVGPYES